MAALQACAPNVPPPTQDYAYYASAQGRNLDLASLQAGRELYVAKCSGCHGLHRPTRYAPELWPKEVDSMVVKAKINAQQRQAILDYLTTASGYLRDSIETSKTIEKANKI